MKTTMLPAVLKRPSLNFCRIFGRLPPNASHQLPEPINTLLIGSSQGTDNPYPRAFLLGIPNIFCDLEVGDRSAISVFTRDLS
jgi:hypothetical protein